MTRTSPSTALAAIASAAFVFVSLAGHLQQPARAGDTTPSSQTPSALPDCLGKPQVKPSEIILACADANARIEKLAWTGWGSSFAAAVGTMTVNDCIPYCAAGHFHNYKAVVIVTGTQKCANGIIAYKTVEYAFLGKSPFAAGSPAANNPSQDFPCK